MTKKHNKRNSKILHQTLASLGALKGASTALQEMGINEIQVHLLDEHGDGVILCLEYDERTGELNKTFSCVNEFYDDEYDTVTKLHDEGYTDEVEIIEVELENGLDACNSPENRELEMDKETDLIEEAISEEYDEIFHSASARKKLPSLLN